MHLVWLFFIQALEANHNAVDWRVQPVYPQMTLFSKSGVPGIITPWHSKSKWLGLISTSPVSSPDYKIGTPWQIPLSLHLNVQQIQLLSLLLLWGPGTNSPNHRSWWMIVLGRITSSDSVLQYPFIRHLCPPLFGHTYYLPNSKSSTS